MKSRRDEKKAHKIIIGQSRNVCRRHIRKYLRMKESTEIRNKKKKNVSTYI